MKFDELFNKVMEKFEVITEQDNDSMDEINDFEDITGQNNPSEIDDMLKSGASIESLASKQPLNIGMGPFEENEEEIESTISDKGINELNKIEQDRLEASREMKISNLTANIKQSENIISRLNVLQAKASNPKKPDPTLLSQCSQALQDEIQKLSQYKNDLALLKPKKIKETQSETSKSSESESKDKKEPKEDKKEPKEDKKEDKEDKKEPKEDKEDNKKEPKEESVNNTDAVLVESKKPMGTEFYLTEF